MRVKQHLILVGLTSVLFYECLLVLTVGAGFPIKIEFKRFHLNGVRYKKSQPKQTYYMMNT